MQTETKNQAEMMEALELVLKHIKPLNRVINLPLFDALGMVLAEDIVCTKPLPAFNNSAMDGYGVKSCDSGKCVVIKHAIMAGDAPSSLSLEAGECVKIMTGAFVPTCVEAVVPFENATINTDGSVLLPSFEQGSNIRAKGEESDIGTVLIKKGTKLTPSHIGQIASQGQFVVALNDRPKVAVLSSGNEIVEPWQKAEDYQIYNSNAPTLVALFKEQNCLVNYIKIVSDTYEATKDAINSLRDYDVIVSTGGVSMGEADFMGKAFLECGMTPIFKKVNIKPGKPTMVGLMDKTAVLALPGNPLSAIVNFYLFALPLLAKMQGRNECYPTFITCKNTGSFKIKNARANIVLGTLSNGKFRAYNGYNYGSGMIAPIAASNAFMVCGENTNEVIDGADIKVVQLNYAPSSFLAEFIQ